MIYWEWKQYMESCVLLLQVAANIFTSITSEVVLREVLSSAQGYNFLCSKYCVVIQHNNSCMNKMFIFKLKNNF